MPASISTQRLSNLIGLIYDCALDPQQWPAALTELHTVLNFRDAIMALMALPSGQPLLMVASGVERPWLDRIGGYGDAIVEMWGGVHKFHTYPIEEPALLSRERSMAAIETNRYCREGCAPQGLIDALGITLARDATTHGSIGLSRHASAGPVRPSEVEAARLLVPHCQRAVAIGKALDLKSLAASSFSAALDALVTAVLLVDADLRIVHANEAATESLSRGHPIASERGVLAVRAPAAHTALEVAVRQAAENEAELRGRAFGIPVQSLEGNPALLHVLPLRHGKLRPGLAPTAAAAIFMSPAGGSVPSPSDALAALFDLTGAEARVLAHIAAGRTPAETARRLGVEASTVKTHLLRVFSKTGTHRQAELIRLAGSLSPPV